MGNLSSFLYVKCKLHVHVAVRGNAASRIHKRQIQFVSSLFKDVNIERQGEAGDESWKTERNSTEGKDHVLRHVVTEPHPSALDDRSHSLNHLSYHPLPPRTHFPPPLVGTGLARLKPRRRQLTNADHGPSFTPTPIKSRRYSPTATLPAPSFSLCRLPSLTDSPSFSLRRSLPSFCFVFAATWHKPPNGPAGRPATAGT